MKIQQTRGYLAQKYGLCRQTISKLLKQVGINHNNHLTPLEVSLFISKVGTPEQLAEAIQKLKD